MNESLQKPTASVWLERVLLLNFVVHFLALLTTAAWLLPGMPGGTSASAAARAEYVAQHPWLWRVGWIPWHLSALFDLLQGIALVTTRWVPRVPALLTLLVTLAAVVVEQSGELPWTIFGPLQAVNAMEYAIFEADCFQRLAVWGASLYMVMALGWTWCFAAAGTWSRGLTWLSVVTWGVLTIGSVGLLLPPAWQPTPFWVTIANGIGFPLLLVWLMFVTELVMRRTRTETAHGRLAPWRHPRRGWFGTMLNVISQSRFLRGLAEWLPMVSLRSDIEEVIYVNYLVDADRLQVLTPPQLEIQRLGPDGRYALFTSLTYRHGHFGPAFLGPLRRLLPSPVQSNWRTYVRDPKTGREGIYFVTTTINSTMHALAARLLSEGVPMHVPRQAQVIRDAEGAVTVTIDPGLGSAPDLRLQLRPGPAELPEQWRDCFASYHDFLAYCVPQDRALSAQPWYDKIVRQEIVLGIPLTDCEPLIGLTSSRAAENYVGITPAVAFRVPRVAFCFSGEHYD